MALTPEPVNLRALLDGMQILVTGALRGDISIRLDLPDDLWPVMADPTQLELAILHAAVNARDAMPDGGSLTVEARNEVVEKLGERRLAGEFVRIEIRDTGTGIPAYLLERVFDPFFTTKAVDQGTGLGMSQIYGFAKQSGGHVGIRSEAAAGTSLILYLPRAADADSPSADASSATFEARTWPAGAGLEVLLVEDNEEVATMTAEMLRELGLSVRRVPDGRSALVLLEDGGSVDIVFSDIVMPGGMSGIELTHEVRRRRPGLPVVLTTGYSEGLSDHAGIDGFPSDHAGIDGFPLLNKPYDIAELQTVFRRVCSPCPHASPKTT